MISATFAPAATGPQSAAVIMAQAAPAPTGLAADATVLTLRGEMPVRDLQPGDRIISRYSGVVTLRELRKSEVEVAMVRIKAGSLGHTQPDRDMHVAPGALVHIRDWRARALFAKGTASVAASRLIDDEFVAAEPTASLTLYDLVFDRPHVIYVDGLEVATGG